MKSFDFKSFAIGLLSTACIFLLLGSSNGEHQKRSRYKLLQDSEFALRYVMYDTYTGAAVALKFNDELKSKKGKPYFTGKEIREALESTK